MNTRKIKAAATIRDVQPLDHLIIVPEEKFLSMADEGIK
jgi:DNA repair protein RadC